MSPLTDAEFRTLLSRALAGDPEAVAEIIHCHADLLRGMLAVQFRMRPDGACYPPGSYQSDMFEFMTEIRDRALRPGDSDRLFVMFRRMMIRKSVEKVRRSAFRRSSCAAGIGVADPREEYQLIKSHLSKKEQEIAEGRLDGAQWDEIAAELDLSPKQARESLTSGLNRVAASLQYREGDTPFN